MCTLCTCFCRPCAGRRPGGVPVARGSRALHTQEGREGADSAATGAGDNGSRSLRGCGASEPGPPGRSLILRLRSKIAAGRSTRYARRSTRSSANVSKKSCRCVRGRPASSPRQQGACGVFATHRHVSAAVGPGELCDSLPPLTRSHADRVESLGASLAETLAELGSVRASMERTTALERSVASALHLLYKLK